MLAGMANGLPGLRLRGGKHRFEGRVEVEYNGQWRGVCDHGWDRNAAMVVCRMLGFPDALRYFRGLVSLVFKTYFFPVRINNIAVNLYRIFLNIFYIVASQVIQVDVNYHKTRKYTFVH